MAKNDRFLREIKRTEKLVDNLFLSLEVTLTAYVSSLVEDFLQADNSSDRSFILAQLRSLDIPVALENVLDEVEEVYLEELSNIQGRFNITAEDVEVTNDVVLGEKSTIRASVVQSLTKLSASLALGATGSVTGAVALAVVPTIKASSTATHTNVSGYRSALEIRKAQEVDPEPLFAYIGPKDTKTRPLCLKILNKNKLYTLEEIAALDRDPDVQLEPVLIYGGGYNCRHRWIYTKRR